MCYHNRMTQTTTLPKDTTAKTRTAYLLTSLLTTPFWVIFNMLPFILYKDLHATPLQISILITLKPMVSLFSGYWSAAVNKRPDRLVSNIIWARILSHLPFLCFPFIDNVWFYIAAFGFYMSLHRGVIPAWMEILKINIPVERRKKIFVWGSFIGYAGNALLPFALGSLLDEQISAWRWIFPATALIALSSTFFKWRIPITQKPQDSFEAQGKSWKETFVEPWKEASELLQRRPDFFRYQIGFMLGGGGIMLMQPALPAYFVDVLNLSYTEMAVAITLCKAIGFAVTSPLWTKYMDKANIFRLSSVPPLCICAFAVCLAAAQLDIYWLYAAYLFYGAMQAGSEMTWHLSGPAFAGKDDSSGYSSINVLAVGVRGAVIPPLGSLIYVSASPLIAIAAGGGICWIAHRCLFSASHEDIPETLS